MVQTGCITYDGLPLASGGAHRLRTRSPKLAMMEVQRFLDACLIPVAPIMASVELLSGPGVESDLFETVLTRLTDRYGQPTRLQLSDWMRHRWSIPLDDTDHLVEQISRYPLSVQGLARDLAPFQVMLDCVAHLRDEESAGALPGQGAAQYLDFVPTFGQRLGESRVFACIGGRSTVSIFLCFPFETANEDFRRAVAHVRAHLPFTLSTKQWKRWTLAQKGDSYLGRRCVCPD